MYHNQSPISYTLTLSLLRFSCCPSNGYVNCHYKHKFANPVDPLDVMRSGDWVMPVLTMHWFNTRIYSCAELFHLSNGVWLQVNGRLPSGQSRGFPLSGGFQGNAP